jgi:hypothetical protein
MEQRSDPAPKCSQCSVAILDSDLALRDHGQWYHVQCVRILTSDERAREYRGLRRANEAKIVRNGAPPARASGLRDEPPAVLCEICQTGIGSLAELAMTASGPTHVRCRPTDSN